MCKFTLDEYSVNDNVKVKSSNMYKQKLMKQPY